MFEFSLRTSPQLVRQIASIERCAGRWERIAESEAVASPQLMERSLARGAHAAFSLDQTAPPNLSLAFGSPDLPPGDPTVACFVAAHSGELLLTLPAVEQLYLRLSAGEGGIEFFGDLYISQTFRHQRKNF